MVQELLASEDLLGMGGEKGQEIELLSSQLERCPRALHRAHTRADHQLSQVQRVVKYDGWRTGQH